MTEKFTQRNSVLDTKEIYKAPERSYPKKTFADGKEVPEEVLHEISEMPQHLDYTVFSKNQLRFVEKVLKTRIYLTNETYIRGPMFFMNIDKPKYWNIENYEILVRSIKFICGIVSEILTSIPPSHKTPVAEKAKEISEKMREFFNYEYLKDRNFEKGIRDLYNPNSILRDLNISATFNDAFAVGLFCATYNKVVSILTYLNPYVQVKKDSGVNTMTAPKDTADNIKARDRKKVAYTDLLLNSTAYDNTDEVLPRTGRVLKGQIRKPIQTGNYGIRTTNNPFIRIYAQPLYSLNILLPVKIAPTFFIVLNNYSSLASNLKNLKLSCNLLKISISSGLSKTVLLNNENKRVNLNVVGKKVAGQIVAKVTGRIGNEYNLDYYSKLMAVRQFNYFKGTQKDGDTFSYSKLPAAELDDEEKEALKEAERLLYETKVTEESIPFSKLPFTEAAYDEDLTINKMEVDENNNIGKKKSFSEVLRIHGIRMSQKGTDMGYYVSVNGKGKGVFRTLEEIRGYGDVEFTIVDQYNGAKAKYRPKQHILDI